MSKQVTINIGGRERQLDWGKFYFTKFYGEITGSDPLNSTDFILKPDKQFDFVVAIVWAGLKTYNKANKIEDDFTKDDVQDWVGMMEESDVAGIVTLFSSTKKPSQQGEAPAPESGA